MIAIGVTDEDSLEKPDNSMSTYLIFVMGVFVSIGFVTGLIFSFKEAQKDTEQNNQKRKHPDPIDYDGMGNFARPNTGK